MTQIELSRDTLTVHVQGVDRLLALKRRFDIPLDHVVSVDANARPADRTPLGALATRVPAAIAPTTFYQQAGRGFWNTPDPDKTLVIGLFDERYARLVIEVEDPGAAASAIREAVRAA
jgi:hypothetical protein